MRTPLTSAVTWSTCTSSSRSTPKRSTRVSDADSPGSSGGGASIIVTNPRSSPRQPPCPIAGLAPAPRLSWWSLLLQVVFGVTVIASFARTGTDTAIESVAAVPDGESPPATVTGHLRCNLAARQSPKVCTARSDLDPGSAREALRMRARETAPRPGATASSAPAVGPSRRTSCATLRAAVGTGARAVTRCARAAGRIGERGLAARLDGAIAVERRADHHVGGREQMRAAGIGGDVGHVGASRPRYIHHAPACQCRAHRGWHSASATRSSIPAHSMRRQAEHRRADRRAGLHERDARGRARGRHGAVRALVGDTSVQDGASRRGARSRACQAERRPRGHSVPLVQPTRPYQASRRAASAWAWAINAAISPPANRPAHA